MAVHLLAEMGAKQTVRTGSHLRRAVRVTGAQNSCMILKSAAEFRKMEVRGTLTVRAIAIMGVLEFAEELQQSA